jgi:hypothetical protein
MELRHQILNVVTFLAVVAGVFFFIVDNVMGFQPDHWLFIVSEITVFCVLYVLARFRGLITATAHIVTIAAYALCVGNYFLNDGDRGATMIIAVMVIVFVAAAHRPKTSVWYAALGLVIVAVCVALQHWHPEWVEPYPTRQAQMLDLVSTFVFASGMGFFMMRMAMLLFRETMERSRQAQSTADRAAAMAALGETLAGIGREFSGPVDALGTALSQTARWWDDEMPRFQKVLAQLTLPQTAAFWQLIEDGLHWRRRPELDERLRRTQTDYLAAWLEGRGLLEPQLVASRLISLRVTDWNPLWLPLLLTPEGHEAFSFVLRLLNLESVMRAGRNAHGQIENLVERVTPGPTPR